MFKILEKMRQSFHCGGAMAVTFSDEGEMLALTTTKPSEEFWHKTQAGFGVRVGRRRLRDGVARRSYLLRYKDAKGMDQKLVLCQVGDLHYSDVARQAREQREVLVRTVNTGQKPLPSLGEAIELYLADRTWLRPGTVDDYCKKWRYLTHSYDKGIAEQHKGRKRADWVTPWVKASTYDLSVAAFNADWFTTRYIELSRNHGMTTAQGVFRLAHSVFKSLVTDDKLGKNPVLQVAAKQRIYARGTPRQALIPKRDLVGLWRWLDTRAHPGVRDLVRIALLTGLRDAVVGRLRWDNINIAERLMLVPPEERGNKGRTWVWIPFCDWLYDNVILPRYNARSPNNPWLIPSHKKVGAPLTDVRGSMATLHNETGILCGPHMSRKTFGTVAQQATGSELIASRLLTHSVKNSSHGNAPAVTAGYIITEDEEMRAAFDKTTTLLLEYAGVLMPSVSRRKSE